MSDSMSNEQREANYLEQSGRKELTPKQRRRIRKKENKSKGR